MNNINNVKHDLDPHSDHSSDHFSQHLQPPQPQRRPRGFAATAAAAAAVGVSSVGKGKKEREREKERTKLRERHRRAITSRMLSGLRQYGNFTLPARADMNDVLASLAREAGWTVEPDGTTYRQSPPPSQMAPFPVRPVESHLSASPLKNCSTKPSLDCQPSVLRMDESLSPASLDSVVVVDRDTKREKYTTVSSINSPECLEADQLIRDVHAEEHENNFTGTPYIPVYVMLTTGIINNFCQLVDPEGVRQELRQLKSLHVDGVVVYCWWGIVEGWSPQKYIWSGYRELFNIIQELKLKLQVVMAFHECEGNVPGEMLISLPKWVLEIGKDDPDIFSTDREGRRNTQCMSWGIDKERVLRGRTGIEVYYDFMRRFRTEFDDLFAEGLISAVEIGLGASGELKYPSFPERMGWNYPGIGEFQCYDKYLQQSLRKAAKLRGHSFWARGPDNAGQYNSRPHETGFFCDRGDYDSYYGRFFLHWYAETLIDHADNVLSLATLAFEETQIVVKIPAVNWWYKTTSHAAELTAGYYNPSNQDGYSPVFEILKKHSVTLKFVCSELQFCALENDETLADPEGLSWQVLNCAWDRGLTIAGQNALPCYDRESYMRILETAKPRNDPDRHQFSFFAYQQPPPPVQREICLSELDYFIKCMHGEIAGDLQP
ncbi:beta-amylase 8 [Macadamia integrifolia]|uniref:beta-amylase 8 n=1 Tax=Macadamia integrifolia TaxID=60698 RepID=UPI001C4F81D6|nr:beta-amylase 8 [Macadamia integrifolia]XP_042505712.1 beta-amylase 8 [Macadamia integrifolia]